MAQPTASHLANLSGLTRTLESKRATLEQARATVERLQQTDMVVAGESWMLGEAMRQARLQIKDRYPEQITWASPVLYGDPTHRLVG